MYYPSIISEVKVKKVFFDKLIDNLLQSNQLLFPTDRLLQSSLTEANCHLMNKTVLAVYGNNIPLYLHVKII